MPQSCRCKKTDRYLSFEGIDCDGNAARIMAFIDRHMAIPERKTLFWEHFAEKRAGKLGVKPDDLFLVHSNINQIRELFEEWKDEEALALLEQVEEECC